MTECICGYGNGATKIANNQLKRETLTICGYRTPLECKVFHLRLMRKATIIANMLHLRLSYLRFWSGTKILINVLIKCININ